MLTRLRTTALALLALSISTVSAQAATLASPGFYNGSTVDASNFTISTVNNLELGLRAIQRGSGPTVVPTGNNYAVPTGAGNSPTRAWWNYDFSVNTQAGGGGSLLTSYIFDLTVSDNNGHSESVNPLTHWGDNTYYNGAPHAAPTVPTDYGFQNSQNMTFSDSPLNAFFDMNANATYTFTLSARSVTGGPAIASTTINVIVGDGGTSNPTPLPASAYAGSTLLLGLALWHLRKRRASA